MRKPTNNTSYRDVCALYEANGRPNYRLITVDDIEKIHGFNIRETDGYSDLTDQQKAAFETYVLKHMNSVGMNTKITLWPRSVHYVREVKFYGPKVWDEDDQKYYKDEIGREYIIIKADGRQKKWKKFFYEKGKTAADVIERSETDFLRVDWKWEGSNTWFHVSDDGLKYY